VKELLSRAVLDTEKANAEMTIWYLFSAISFIAAVASGNSVAKEQHTTLGAYALCIFLGVILGVFTGAGNLACAMGARRNMERKGRSAKIATMLLLAALSVGWIVLADRVGRWLPAKALHLFGFR
jgi:hypothetical protein